MGKCCGLRINECYGLKWENVDIERGTINIDRQMQYQEGVVKLVATKTRNSKRTIYLNDFMKAYFQKIADQKKEDEVPESELENLRERRKKLAENNVEVREHNSGKEMYDWVYSLIIALIICVIIFAFFI